MFEPVIGLRRRLFGPKTVMAIAVLYGVLLAVFGMLRHHNFWSGALDMGVYGQGEWLISHGHANSSIIGRNLFSDHVSALYAVLAVGYRLWSSVDLLIIVQAVALACCVHPHVRLAKSNGFSTGVGVGVAVFHAAFLSAAVFDFHTSVLATPFLLWALVAVQEGRPRLALVMALVIVLCRADLVVCVGALMVLASRGLRVRLAGVVVFAGMLLVLPAFLGGATAWDIHYRTLGESPVDAVFHPWRAASVVFSWLSVKSVLLWVAPFALLPALSPRRMAAALVAGAPLLLSTTSNLHQPWFHYGAIVEPFVFYAVLDPGIRRWMPVARVQLLVLVMSAATLCVASPLSTIAPPNHRLWNVVHARSDADYQRIVHAIPPSAGVAAVDPFASHLVHRPHLYAWPSPFVDTRPLGPAPTADVQARVSFVVVTNEDEARARGFGFVEVVTRSGGYVVLRR